MHRIVSYNLKLLQLLQGIVSLTAVLKEESIRVGRKQGRVVDDTTTINDNDNNDDDNNEEQWHYYC
jgi:uncharacterized membrane protein YgcG